MAAAAGSGNPLGTRRRRDADSAYLLTSFARCGWCVGSLVATSRRRSGKERDFFCGCLTHWKKGGSPLPPQPGGGVAQIDAEVLGAVETDVLRPAVVERAIAVALEELSPARQEESRDEAAGIVRTLEAECARLAEAIALGGRLDVLFDTLQDREQRLQDARATLYPDGRAASGSRAIGH